MQEFQNIIIKKEEPDNSIEEGVIEMQTFEECFIKQEEEDVKIDINTQEVPHSTNNVPNFTQVTIKTEIEDNNTEQAMILEDNKNNVVPFSSSLDKNSTCQQTRIREQDTRKHLSVAEKTMIMNVYKSEYLARPYELISDIVQHVVSITGVCSSTVYRIVREYKNSGKLAAPKTNKNRKSYILDQIDECDKEVIRKKVHSFFLRNQIPTIGAVLKLVNEDEDDLPLFKRTTFYKLLKTLNFEYKKLDRKSILTDKEEIMLWRRKYLRQIIRYRNEGREIYYTDETWIIAGHTTRSKNQSSKRKRLVVCHIGNENGFVPNSLWSFESRKSGDEEIDAISYERWLASVLPKLKQNAVIVMDDAPYHSRKTECIPTSAGRKADIKNWLLSKNIHFEEDMVEAELLHIVRQHKDRYTSNILDELAERHGITILRYPPYHSELNPIEQIWTELKNKIASMNTTFKFIDMKNVVDETLATITLESWKKYVQHVKDEVEPKMWKLDDIIEEIIEGIAVNVNEDGSSDLSE